MARPSDFKPTQVFDWDLEPSDERPTDFQHSTGYSALSGFGSIQPVSGYAHRRVQARQGSMARVAVVACLVLGLSLSALFTLVHYLRPGA